MHAYHDNLPGYDGRQIWVDGCEECEHRASRLPYSIRTLDNEKFRLAVQRAEDMIAGRDVGRISDAESRLLDTLELVTRRYDATVR